MNSCSWPMPDGKRIVSVHEAGHALASLISPLREHLVEVQLHRDTDEWFGSTRFQGNRDQSDPSGAYEIAKGLAGPIAQLQAYPDSVPPQLAVILKATGGLQLAAKYILENDLAVAANFWPDIDNWRRYCLQCLRSDKPIEGQNFLAVEKNVREVFSERVTQEVLNELTDALFSEEKLDKEALLNMRVDDVPRFTLPSAFP